MIKILDICSGIGGFSLGLEATGGFDTVAFCEFDDFCCKVLNKHWPNVPIYKDLKEIGNEPERIIQEFDLICGGIPCQPFSLAGKQKGKEDDRHLWPYMYEIVKSKKPTWVIVENVGGFVNVALDDVCLDLETQGYATQSFIIPACSVEAPHKRDRIWILGKLMADTESNGEDGVLRTTESEHDQGDTRMESSSSSDGRSEREVSQDVANANDTGDRTPGRTTDGDRQKTVEGWQEQSQLGSSRSSEDVANSKELEDHEHDNGERTQQDREHRVSQQSGGEGSLGGKEDVAHTSSERLERGVSGDDQGGQEWQAVSRSEDQQDEMGADTRCSSGLSTEEDVSYSNSEGLQGSEEAGDTQESREEREQLASGQDSSLSKGHTEPQLGGMADGVSPRLDGHLGFEREPSIPRVATGIPNRVNRLKTLGNSIVPQIVYNIGLAILEEEERDAK